MDIDVFEKLLGTERDSALLRLSLATALSREGRSGEAEQHLVEATKMDPAYTAAWKQLGKLRLTLDDPEGARQAWQSGIDAARVNGDKQAEKEMAVFLRRLDKSSS